jgi:membrane-bound metal-dependent hydrolase YbcI (DUF457 family)
MAGTAVLIAASLAPDSDALLAVFGREAYLKWHLTATHSVLGVPVLAALVALLARRFTSIGAMPAFMLALAALTVHVMMDVLTPWGTMVGWPFSAERYALDWVATTDAVMWGILAAAAVGGWALGRRGVAASRALLALGAAYILFCAMGHGSAVEYFRESLARVRVRPSEILAFPNFGGPLTWNAVARTPDRYWQGRVHSLVGLKGRLAMYLRTPLPPGLDSPTARSFMEWARLPLATFHSSDLTEASLCDLRFLGTTGGMPFTARLSRSALPGVPSPAPGRPAAPPGRFEWSDGAIAAPAPDMEFEMPGDQGGGG